jgi:xanthine dehydrogenase molybdopterin-binding subunit B
MAHMTGIGKWASELSRALGEDPGEVRSINLHCEVHQVVTCTIEKYVQRENKRVLEVIKKVIWTEDIKEEKT